MHPLRRSGRQFRKNKWTTLMLVLSLTIGITAYLLISVKVFYNHSYDTYLPAYKNIYRIVSSAYTDNTLTISQPRTQRILGQILEESMPAVKKSGYLCGTIQKNYRIGENSFSSELGYHCSHGFTEIFSLQILQGSSSGILTQPNRVIISESFAHRHFGTEDPVGKIIHQYPANQFEIEAVFRDFPENSHIRPDFLISIHDNMHLPPPLLDDWGEFGFYTYLELEEDADREMLEEGITRLCRENNQALMTKSNTSYTFTLQSISDIHTKSQLKNEINKNVRGDYLRILQLISICILVISGFNYVYFSHTRISRNSIQFGLKKAFGASHTSLLGGFILDSFILHAIALVLSVGIFQVLRLFSPQADELVGFAMLPGRFWFILFLVFMASSLLNPIVLIWTSARKSPLEMLTRQYRDHPKRISFRQIFTTLQFVIIISLLSSIAGISRQVNFLRERDTGISIEDKLVIKTPSNMRRSSSRIINLDAFEQELTKIPGIQDVSISNVIPGDIPAFSFNASEQLDMDGIKTALFIANNHFIQSYQIEIIEGEDFSKRRDQTGIINSVCMKQLGYSDPEDVLGRKLYLQDESGMQSIEIDIIGVCEAFNFTNTKESPDPVVLLDWTKNIMWNNYSLTISGSADMEDLLSRVETHFKQTFPNYPFEYFWVEDYFNEQFEDEYSVLRSLKNFAIVAVLLAVLSLLSMARQMSLARTKEIGIRKVNGASKLDIIMLLNLYFAKWIGIASLIAIPLSWYFLSTWLRSFAYRENISIWIFLAASGFAFITGIITVTLQSLRAANINPADTLKYE